MRFFKYLLLGILIYGATVNANVQYDLKGFLLFNQYKSGDSINRTDVLWSIEHDVKARKDFPSSWAIYFNDAVDGSTTHYALPERTIPFLHAMLFGMEFRKKGAVGIEFSQDMFGGAQQIKPEYLKKIVSTTNDTINNTTVVNPVIRQKTAYQGRFFFDIPANRWQFLGSVNYFQLRHSLESIGVASDPDSILQKRVSENITYSNLAIQFTAVDAFRIGAGAWLKNDIGNVPFDYGNFSLSVNGDPVIKLASRKKIYIAYDLTGLYRFGQAYEDKTYATGLGTSVYLRPVIKFSTMSFIKGVIILDIAHETFKQWYEATIRRAWKSNSFIEASYFGSYGTLFPRHGIRLNGSFFMGKIGLHPKVEGIIRYSANDSLKVQRFRFHRLAPGGEISLRPFKFTEFFIGGDLYYYNNYRPFTDRGFAYLGIRGW